MSIDPRRDRRLAWLFLAAALPLAAGPARGQDSGQQPQPTLDDTIDARVTLANFRNTLTGVFIRLDGASAGGITEVALGQPSNYRRRGKTYHATLTGIVVPPPVEGDQGDFFFSMLDGMTSVVATSDVYPNGEASGRLRFLHAKRGRH